MSRQKFPSDHRRYFRVMEDILDDCKLNECDPIVFRFYIRLLAMLNRTKSRDGTIVLGRAALIACSGRTQLVHALRWARAGADLGLFTIRTEGERHFIHVPKWSEIQGFDTPPFRRNSDVTPLPTPTPTPTPIKSSRTSVVGEQTKVSEASLACARALIEKIKVVHPGTRIPTEINRWAKVYDQMIRLDKREPRKILAQIAWLFGANQKNDVSFVVLSPSAHRKKFDRIEVSVDNTAGMARGPGPLALKREAEEAEYQRKLRENFARNRDRSRGSGGLQPLAGSLGGNILQGVKDE